MPDPEGSGGDPPIIITGPETGGSGGDPPIIITGGSVTVEFDKNQLPEQPDGTYSNRNKKIKRIEVTGDGSNINETVPNGQITIRIYYE